MRVSIGCLIALAATACDAKPKTAKPAQVASEAGEDATEDAVVAGTDATAPCLPYCDDKKCDDGCGGLCEGKKCYVPGCSTGATCAAGKCQGYTEITCNDDNKCTSDSCDAVNGVCLYVPTTEDCDDGDACTVKDHCNQGVCSGKMTCPSCGDGVCNGDESVPNCPEDCGFLLKHLGGPCPTPGFADGCDPGFFCVARSEAGGGNVCVADVQTWAPIPDSHPVTDFKVLDPAYVRDIRTELIWAVNALPRMTWAEALVACTKFTAGGFQDWRLPTRGELVSLMDVMHTGSFQSSFTSAPLLFEGDNSGDAYVHWSAVYQYDGSPSTQDESKLLPASSAWTGLGGFSFAVAAETKLRVRCVR